MDVSAIFLQAWTVLMLLFTIAQAESRCKFPKAWKGRWHQNGLGEINIRQNSMSSKGICWEHHRDYYLVKNREENCYKCLLIMDRHENVLQYKESYCLPKGTLREICEGIKVEGVLYTLVREPHYPVKCPFNDAYYFNYNDFTSGLCRYPISHAQPCAGDSKYRFHFNHCTETAHMHGREPDFECVATWKDGSDMYLYGKFSGVKFESKDESFRCFKYESYASDLFMSMSVDATCRGLRSAKDGPFIMQFTKDLNGWPAPACTLPSWFGDHVWRDMSGKHVFEVPDRRRGTVAINFRRRPDSRETTKIELRCKEELQRNDTSRFFMFVSHSSVGCTTKYQCVVIKQKADDLVEVALGKLVEYDEAKVCATRGEFPEDYLLIRTPTESIPCPFQGRRHVHSGTANCHEDILSGCNGTSQLDVRCEEDAGGILQTECLASWTRENTTLVLVRRLDVTNKHDRISCVSFTERQAMLEFSTDARCHKGIKDLVEKPIELSLSRTSGSCEEPIVHQGVGSSYAKVGIDGKGEGPYQHVGRENRDGRPSQNREVSYSTAQSSANSAAILSRIFGSISVALVPLIAFQGLPLFTR